MVPKTKPTGILYLIKPSSAALQKVFGHMGAVAIRFTLLVWSPNMCTVSLTVRSWTCTLESAAPVMRIRSPECGRNCGTGLDAHLDKHWGCPRGHPGSHRAGALRQEPGLTHVIPFAQGQYAHSRVTSYSRHQSVLITHPNLLQPLPSNSQREQAWDLYKLSAKSFSP